MRGVSLHWFEALRGGVGDIDIWGAFWRSVRLALAVTVLTSDGGSRTRTRNIPSPAR